MWTVTDLSDVPIYMPQKSILAIYELQFFFKF